MLFRSHFGELGGLIFLEAGRAPMSEGRLRSGGKEVRRAGAVVDLIPFVCLSHLFIYLESRIPVYLLICIVVSNDICT